MDREKNYEFNGVERIWLLGWTDQPSEQQNTQYERESTLTVSQRRKKVTIRGLIGDKRIHLISIIRKGNYKPEIHFFLMIWAVLGLSFPPCCSFILFFYKIFFFLSRYGRMGDKKEIVIHVCLTFFPFRRFSRHGAIPGPPSHTWLG